MRFISKPHAKLKFCSLGPCSQFVVLMRVILICGLCGLALLFPGQASAGAWVNAHEQLKLFLTQQKTREWVKKSPYPSVFREVRKATEKQAYLEYGWRPDVTLTGNIILSNHTTGPHHLETKWLGAGIRHKADWAKLDIIPFKSEFRNQHKKISKAASIEFGLRQDEGYHSRTGISLALSQGEKIEVARLDYLELLVEVNQELVLWSSDEGFYRAHNKIMLTKDGFSLNYNRLDSFSFGEKLHNDHIGYWEVAFPAALFFGKTLPENTSVKLGKGDGFRKGYETASGERIYLQLKFDLML